MTKDEALAFDLALEALKLSSVTVDSFGVQRKIQEAITALKKVRALDKMAENARELGLDYEPVAPVREDWGPGPHECHSLTAAPVQEPVAWIEHHKGGDNLEWENPGGKCTPLYTTPPAAQRQWQGLTDAEVMQTMSGDWTSQFYFARAIEAKLKEKNT